MALGSVTELQNQLVIARDIGYLSNEGFQMTTERTVVASKLINGLIKSSKILTT